MTKILLVGYGRMGKLVESLAGEYGCEIAGIAVFQQHGFARGPENSDLVARHGKTCLPDRRHQSAL